MKRIVLAVIAIGMVITSFAQIDSTQKKEADTIIVGGMIIIRKGAQEERKEYKDIEISNKNKVFHNPNINWWILDLGFANYNDKTNYAAATASGFIQDGITDEDMKLRTGKSVNVGIWIFMQRINIIKNIVNLKYGLGLDLNNYRFENKTIRLEENPTKIVLDSDLRGIKKNKLAADYITMPAMLNFNFSPQKKDGYGVSAGISAGYLYSSRQKFKIDGHTPKTHDDFDLRRWKLSYIGELNLGIVHLYGSYATRSMWAKGLNQTPYTVGIRFSYL